MVRRPHRGQTPEAPLGTDWDKEATATGRTVPTPAPTPGRHGALGE